MTDEAMICLQLVDKSSPHLSVAFFSSLAFAIDSSTRSLFAHSLALAGGQAGCTPEARSLAG